MTFLYLMECGKGYGVSLLWSYYVIKDFILQGCSFLTLGLLTCWSKWPCWRSLHGKELGETLHCWGLTQPTVSKKLEPRLMISKKQILRTTWMSLEMASFHLSLQIRMQPTQHTLNILFSNCQMEDSTKPLSNLHRNCQIMHVCSFTLLNLWWFLCSSR